MYNNLEHVHREKVTLSCTSDRTLVATGNDEGNCLSHVTSYSHVTPSGREAIDSEGSLSGRNNLSALSGI